MGTNAAVSIAEISMGFLELSNNLNPPTWYRYIDDGLKVYTKSERSIIKNQTLTKLNSLSTEINWTADDPSDTCIFLDIEINQSTGNFSTHRKHTAAFNNYVPWSSYHPTHTKINLAFNLFHRATRINNTIESQNNEIQRVELALLSLGYPSAIIQKQKIKALQHIPAIKVQNALPTRFMYFTTTRNEVSSSKKLQSHLNTVFNLLKESVYFENVIFKRSFRQQPSLNSSLVMKISSHMHTSPVPCAERACKICHSLFLLPKWTSNCGHIFQTARVTCSSRFVIYILVNQTSNETLYVGQTAQQLNTRISQHRTSNSWVKNTDFWIVPLKGAIKAVHRIEKEQSLIQLLKPSKNKHVDYFWWEAKSHHNHEQLFHESSTPSQSHNLTLP